MGVRGWEGAGGAVVRGGEEPFLIMHELSTNHVRYANEHDSMWIQEVHFYAEHYRLHRRTYLTPQWPQMAADLLRRRGIARGRLGVDSPGGPIARVPDLLPDLRLVDAGRILRAMRMVTCEGELVLIREGARL